MLIGIDASRAAGSQRTGTENYSYYLIHALLREDGVNRYRLYLQDAPAEGFLPHNERVEWRVMPWPRLWTHLRLSWEMRAAPPDVLFVPSHVLPIIHPRASVVTVHDLGYLRFPEAHTRAARWYLDLSTRWNARCARRVVVDSQATADDLVAAYGTPRGKIRLAYPAGAEGMAPEADPVRLAAVRERYGTGERYFLYVGTLQPRKNYPVLLQAFAALRKRASLPHTLAIVGGRGWLTEEIDATIARLGLEDQVQLLGFAPDADLPALYTGASLLAFPSLYEGFGLPALEAMACGTPVVGSTAPSLPEVCGDAALLVDPTDATGLADALERVLTDRELAHTLVARGRRRAAQFRWEDAAANLLSVYRQVVGQV